MVHGVWRWCAAELLGGQLWDLRGRERQALQDSVEMHGGLRVHGGGGSEEKNKSSMHGGGGGYS